MLRNLTPRRRVALFFAAAWLIFFAAVLLPGATNTSPYLWPIPVVLVAVAFSAFATSAVAVELFRSAVPGLAGWADDKHFRVVVLAFAFLLPVQLLGVLTAMRAHGHSAF